MAVRHDTIQLLEENIGNTFWPFNCTNVSLGQPSKIKERKASINGTHPNLQGFYTTKETKRDESTAYMWTGRKYSQTMQPMTWFPKQLIQLNSSDKPSNRKTGRRLLKEDIQMTNRHRGRRSTLLITRKKCKSKLHWATTSQWSERPSLKSLQITCWRGSGEKGALLYCCWESELAQRLGNSMEGPQEAKQSRHVTQQPHSWAHVWTDELRAVHPCAHSSTAHNSQDVSKPNAHQQRTGKDGVAPDNRALLPSPKNGTAPSAATRTGLEIILPCEVSQRKIPHDTTYVESIMWQ